MRKMPARLNDLLARDEAARTSYLERLWMDAELFATFLGSAVGDAGRS